MKYVQCFNDFNKVVKSCFSIELKTDYVNHINNFRQSYLDLGIRVTPKVHTVINHIEYFCEKNQRGLGFYSEQTLESSHAKFSNFWNKYKVKKTNQNFPEILLKTVKAFNSKRL